MHKLFQLSSQFFPEIRIFEKLDKKLISKHFEVRLKDSSTPRFSKHIFLLPGVWKLLEYSRSLLLQSRACALHNITRNI